MEKTDVKELLVQQMKQLAERSKTATNAKLCSITGFMCRIAEALDLLE